MYHISTKNLFTVVLVPTENNTRKMNYVHDVLALSLNETITRIHVTVPLKSSAFMFNTRVGLGAGLSGAYKGPPIKVDAR